MPNHKFVTKQTKAEAKKKLKGLTKKHGGPSPEIEEEMTKERKRDFSILGKIWKGYKQVKGLTKKKKKK